MATAHDVTEPDSDGRVRRATGPLCLASEVEISKIKARPPFPQPTATNLSVTPEVVAFDEVVSRPKIEHDSLEFH